MNRVFPILIILAIAFSSCLSDKEEKTQPNDEVLTGKCAIAVHGGAGNLKKLNLTEAEQEEYKLKLTEALKAGDAILRNGGTSVDAVETAIKIMEDSPLFNAGKGSVFNHDGINEMDAAIMSGSNLSCGAVAGVRRIKNPITAARKIMEKDEFILLSGTGAEEFAKAQGVEMVDPSYFFTPHRWQQLEDALKEDSVKLDHSEKKSASLFEKLRHEEKYGTVGCVALDQYGNITAGTSTGGLTNKRYGRIGDSPLIGAGTFADNNSCAVSCTGKGEDFIRLNVAHEIASACKYGKLSLDSAVSLVINNQLRAIKGRGGCISINRKGEISMEFTTSGMFRGSIDNTGNLIVSIYSDKP